MILDDHPIGELHALLCDRPLVQTPSPAVGWATVLSPGTPCGAQHAAMASSRTTAQLASYDRQRKADWHAVVADLRLGLSPTEIAYRHGISRFRVYQIEREAGLPCLPRLKIMRRPRWGTVEAAPVLGCAA